MNFCTGTWPRKSIRIPVTLWTACAGDTPDPTINKPNASSGLPGCTAAHGTALSCHGWISPPGTKVHKFFLLLELQEFINSHSVYTTAGMMIYELLYRA